MGDPNDGGMIGRHRSSRGGACRRLDLHEPVYYRCCCAHRRVLNYVTPVKGAKETCDTDPGDRFEQLIFPD